MASGDLADFIANVSGEGQLAVEENLGNGYVRLRVAEAERRQAKHDIRSVEDIVIEMLRNARDAHAKKIFLASTREGNTRKLVFIDDGDGIPQNMQEAIFEPRVTSKLETMIMDSWGVHGRGMALYSIRENTKDVHVASSAPSFGSAISVTVDLEELPERTDQSTQPLLGSDEQGKICVSSGPHNIMRAVAEFALDEKDKLAVTLGSPAEIISTLVFDGKEMLETEGLAFCANPQDLPVVARAAAAVDAADLTSIAGSLGLEISERTAHRILSGQIDPLAPFLDGLLSDSSAKNASKENDMFKDYRGLKVSRDDLERFSRSLKRSFSVLSDRYFVHLCDEPKIRVGKDAITVKFPIEKDM